MIEDFFLNMSLIGNDSYFAIKIAKINDLVANIFDRNEYIVNKPLLFVSDHFFSIRNEIDIEAETLLLENENDLDRINQMRETMIESIKSYENDCLARLTKLRQLEELEKTFSVARETFYKRKKEIEEVLAKTNCDSLDAFSDLETTVADLLYEMRTYMIRFKSFLFNEKTLIYKKHYLNDLGILIIFDSVYMDDAETEVVK